MHLVDTGQLHYSNKWKSTIQRNEVYWKQILRKLCASLFKQPSTFNVNKGFYVYTRYDQELNKSMLPYFLCQYIDKTLF